MSRSATKTPADQSLIREKGYEGRGLDFFQEDAPEAGTATEVAPGVFWLRFPLPMRGLNHINLWALRDGDGWVIVDTGIADKVSEYFLCRLMAADTGKVAPKEGIRFYQKCGFTDAQIELYKMRFGGFGKAIVPLPQSYDRLTDGELGMIGGREWRIVIGAGHSPEHACLYCPDLNLALTGDQLLPNISSNVSVWPTEPEGNPLEDWIRSCHKCAHKRLSKLIEHHEKALTRLAEHCRTPRLATEVYSVLFRREINDGNRIMAVGESVAHLNCLKARGVVSRRLNDRGQFTYKTRTGWMV